MVFSNLKNENWAYLAGMIDADGCVTLITRSTRNKWAASPRVSISNTDKSLLENIQEQFGGRLISASKKNIEKWKELFMLYWTNSNGLKYILEGIIPYLRKKNRQSEICLEVNKTIGIYKGYKGLPEKLRIERLELLKELRSLNRRGVKRGDKS